MTQLWRGFLCAPALSFALAFFVSAQPVLAESPTRKDSEWPVYGADKANTKYSPLDQIRPENVAKLRIAWRWRSIDEQIQQQNPNLKPWLFEVTPYDGWRRSLCEHLIWPDRRY
jgi:quinoprotein glucose dehydrogenase